MNKNRLEAFSDGVIAILITIMVLELHAPHGETLQDLIPLVPKMLSYILSFLYIGIYWNNHHHLLNTVKHVSGSILWANLHLLFWLSLLPFVTAWAGENNFGSIPVALYGFVLMMSAISYTVLTKILISKHGGKHSLLSKAVGNDFKGKISIVLYATAITLACWLPIGACLIYIGVAAMWLIPDRRIEKVVQEN